MSNEKYEMYFSDYCKSTIYIDTERLTKGVRSILNHNKTAVVKIAKKGNWVVFAKGTPECFENTLKTYEITEIKDKTISYSQVSPQHYRRGLMD